MLAARSEIGPYKKFRSAPIKTIRTSISTNLIRTLSKAGFCSRKQAVELVKNGRVQVRGRTIRDPGFRAPDPKSITVNGKPMPDKTPIYILLNKPAGYVTTRSDERGRKTVYELLGMLDQWIMPVGRLDLESEGLLIFTNDTKFGDYLTDPQNKIPRTYRVLTNGPLSPEECEKVIAGIDIGRNEISRPTALKIVAKSGQGTWLEVTLLEGKNREIRRLFEALGRKVERLIRISFGPYQLADLKPGTWKKTAKMTLKKAMPIHTRSK